MGQQIGAPGQYLPIGQFTNPASLQAQQNNIPGSLVTLAPGECVIIAPGRFIVSTGLYNFLQFKDPVTQTWRTQNSARMRGLEVTSDGQNIRVANLLGCPVAAIVTASNGGYAEATTTVTPSAGNSTWQAIVGGMLSVTAVSAGLGYGIAPVVEIAPPPAPGVQATGYATIAGTSVTGVTLTNVGAGYDSVPEIRLVPSPTDPNYIAGTLTSQATASLGIVGGTSASGSITAILCTNPGASVTATPTLTIAGSGTGGAATAVRMTTMVSGSVVAGGASITGAALMTVGGRPTATPLWTNPGTDMSAYTPRPAQGDFFATGGSLISVASIYDGGMFAGTPTAILLPANGTLQTATASVTVTTGAVNDTCLIQPGI